MTGRGDLRALRDRLSDRLAAWDQAYELADERVVSDLETAVSARGEDAPGVDLLEEAVAASARVGLLWWWYVEAVDDGRRVRAAVYAAALWCELRLMRFCACSLWITARRVAGSMRAYKRALRSLGFADQLIFGDCEDDLTFRLDSLPGSDNVIYLRGSGRCLPRC